jgi:hypothetical protein
MRMRPLVLLLATALAVNAAGGVAYEYTTVIQSDRFADESASGRVWVEGNSYRAEVKRGDGSRHAVISRDGDRTATIVNLQTQTARPRQRPGKIRSSSLFVWPTGQAELQGVPDVQYRNGGPSRVAGRDVTKHLIEAKFSAASANGIGGTYEVVARIWTSDRLPKLPMKSPLRTGFAEVDRQLDEAAEKIKGMVLRHELEITRTLDGGPPQTEMTITTVTKVRELDVPEETFAVTATPVIPASR